MSWVFNLGVNHNRPRVWLTCRGPGPPLFQWAWTFVFSIISPGCSDTAMSGNHCPNWLEASWESQFNKQSRYPASNQRPLKLRMGSVCQVPLWFEVQAPSLAWMGCMGLSFSGNSRKVSCCTCFLGSPRSFCILRMAIQDPGKAENRNEHLCNDRFCTIYHFSPWPNLIITILRINSFWDWSIWPWSLSISWTVRWAHMPGHRKQGHSVLFCYVLFCLSIYTPKAILFHCFLHKSSTSGPAQPTFPPYPLTA